MGDFLYLQQTQILKNENLSHTCSIRIDIHLYI